MSTLRRISLFLNGTEGPGKALPEMCRTVPFCRRSARLSQTRFEQTDERVREPVLVADIRERAEISLVGTPLTHARYLRRYKGTYGPAVKAGEGLLPGPATPIPGLYCCCDSTFPGIGLPAVAASGAVCANTLSPITSHWKLLDALGI